MIALHWSPQESYNLVLEVYQDKAFELLRQAKTNINQVKVLKNSTLEFAAAFCASNSKSVENSIRYQAAYFIMKKNESKLSTIQEQIKQCTSQLVSLDKANISATDRAELNQFYNERIKNLRIEEIKIISNIQVTGAVEFTSHKSPGTHYNKSNHPRASK